MRLKFKSCLKQKEISLFVQPIEYIILVLDEQSLKPLESEEFWIWELKTVHHFAQNDNIRGVGTSPSKMMSL